MKRRVKLLMMTYQSDHQDPDPQLAQVQEDPAERGGGHGSSGRRE